MVVNILEIDPALISYQFPKNIMEIDAVVPGENLNCMPAGIILEFICHLAPAGILSDFFARALVAMI